MVDFNRLESITNPEPGRELLDSILVAKTLLDIDNNIDVVFKTLDVSPGTPFPNDMSKLQTDTILVLARLGFEYVRLYKQVTDG